MEDAAFEEIRAALAPGRQTTERLGALFLLRMNLDGDDRIGSLLSTLLGDRDPEVAAATAALVYEDARYRELLSTELQRAWSTQRPEYRALVIEHGPPPALDALAQRCCESPDTALKLTLLTRSHALADTDGRESAALYLSRDASAHVRSAAAVALAGISTKGASLALQRLLTDPDVAVVAAAARAFGAHATPQQVESLLVPLTASLDNGVMTSAREGIRIAQEKHAHEAVLPLVQRQKDLIAAGEYNQALALAGQVFMRVLDHPECLYQMARAAAGAGDTRRAMRLLANAFEAGFADGGDARIEPLFAPLRQTDMWEEVMALCGATKS